MVRLKQRIADHMTKAGPTNLGLKPSIWRWIGFGVSFFLKRGGPPLRVRECDQAKEVEARLNEVTRFKVDELKTQASRIEGYCERSDRDISM